MQTGDEEDLSGKPPVIWREKVASIISHQFTAIHRKSDQIFGMSRRKRSVGFAGWIVCP
jgi:hypothetical protein